MKTALHQKRNDGMTKREVETLVPEEREFASDVQTCDFHLHIVVQAIEDQLLRDAA